MFSKGLSLMKGRPSSLQISDGIPLWFTAQNSNSLWKHFHLLSALRQNRWSHTVKHVHYSKAAGAACNQATLSPAAEQASAGVSSYTTGSLSYVSLTLDSDRLCGCLQQPVELLCCFHSSATACLLHVLCGFEWPCYIAYVANSLWLVGAPGHRPTGP